MELDVASPNAPSSATRSGNVIDVSFAGAGATAGDMINVTIGDHRITYTLTGADVASGRAKVTIPASIVATMDEHAGYGVALVDRSGNVSDYLLTRFEEVVSSSPGSAGIDYKVVDFNNEAPRDLVANGIPTDFGLFSLSITARTAGQGVLFGGGNVIGGGFKPDAGETGLLIEVARARFFLKDGVHAQSLTLDIGLSPPSVAGRPYAIDFYDDKGALVYREVFRTGGINDLPQSFAICSYQFVMPDGVEFSSFGFSAGVIENGKWFYSPYNAFGLAWIDNIGFAGGAFGPIAPVATVDFSNEAPRDLVANGIPTDFGLFSLSVTSNRPGQGIRVAGGNTIGGGLKPDAGETGLLIDTNYVGFYLNNGAHARSLTIDVGGSDEKQHFVIDFFDDAGKLVYSEHLTLGDLKAPGIGIHSYHTVLPNNGEFASFRFKSSAVSALTWIDNVGFGGGSFAHSNWTSTTELVPPADVQHVLETADAAYYGSAHGTEFQLDHVSYFAGAHAGLHGGAGIDTLKLGGANELLDLSRLLNVGG
ncbi:hypothetical protein ACV22Z_35615, partial [Burkholderia sp. PU8-34]